jgi:hypothetical protein
MKSSAVLLAGLLAGLSLGGVAHAQPPSAPTAFAQRGGDDDDDAPPVKMNGKQAKCVVECQKPVQQCTQRCKHNKKTENACQDRCGKQLNACMKKCGVNINDE